jgi:glycosyltransferase involved in cell wall biosynthesis
MKICVIIPAYNAGKVIASVIERIPAGLIDEVIVVDDASRDNTFEVLSAIPGLTVLRHSENRGYGGTQITLHDTAIQRGADVVVLMHSDGGHFPEELPRLLEPILAGQAEVVLGARIHGLIEKAQPLLGSSLLGALLNGPIPATRLMVSRIVFLERITMLGIVVTGRCPERQCCECLTMTLVQAIYSILNFYSRLIWQD